MDANKQPDYTQYRTQSIAQKLFDCATAFNRLIDTKYHIVLGRSGKSVAFDLTFSRYDCHHLMGIHYLTDRPDRRSRAKIFDDILNSGSYRQHLATSDFWNEKTLNRVSCTTILEQLIDDNRTIFHFNPKRTRHYSEIRAEYLMVNKDVEIPSLLIEAPRHSSVCSDPSDKADTDNTTDLQEAHMQDAPETQDNSASITSHDVYIFIDKRNNSDERYCKSIFPKTKLDYTEGQAVWTLLYKEKITYGSSAVLYHHKGYVVP